MIKVSGFLTRRPDLTHEQFSEYWKDKHAPLVMSLDSFASSVRRYIQQRPLNNVPGSVPILPYDGVAELWFDNLRSALATFADQDYASIVAKDEENFLDRTKTVIYRPRTCPSEELDPAGTSNSMNVRLTEAEIHAVSMACHTAVGSHR